MTEVTFSVIKRNMIILIKESIIQKESQNLVLFLHTVYLLSPKLCQGWTKGEHRKLFSKETCTRFLSVQHMMQLFLVQSADSSQLFFFFYTWQRALLSVK